MHPYVLCSIIYNGQAMEATQVPINRRMYKKAVVHIHVEYYSAMKKKEMLSFAIAWTDLEGIMLSERYDFIYMRNLKNNINTQKIQK